MLRRRAPDSGFTLIELLIAVVILGILSLPLANGVIGVIRNTADTGDRLSLSHDQQISAAYFSQDVAGLGTRDASQPNEPLKASVQLNAAYNAGPTCGSATTPQSIIRFLYDDYDESVMPAVQNTDVVAYYILTVGSERQLHRIKCLGPSTTPASDAVLAHDLDVPNPQVTCQPATCTASSPPQSMTLTFGVIKSKSTYSITLTGQRRQS
jgi:prepilin-type N-terminal cleavage/methylation domain-containing protein